MWGKRLFDLAASIAGLVTLLPLLVLIALWIKCDSAGPVLFRQVRVGRGGVPFRIFKFRTMTVNTESSSQITVGEDARITRCGSTLRRCKLDELPQLLNVVFGHMSLVGPRPEVPRYVELYPGKLREIVLSVPPGITDWASIHYREENALLGVADDPERVYVEEIMPTKLGLNVRYVQERSFLVDLQIILTTLRAVFLPT